MRRFLVLSLTLAGCAGKTNAPSTEPASAAPTPPTEATKLDLDALLARELDKLPAPRALSGPQGVFTAEVPAARPPEVKVTEGPAIASWSIGTEQDVQCIIYAQRMNIADVLNTLFTSAVLEKMSTTKIERIDAGEAGGQPFLEIDALYTMESAGHSAVGEIKLAAIAHHDVSLVCTHDEPGYRASFRNTIAALAATFKINEDAAPAKPSYHAIHAIEVAGARFGFHETVLVKDADDKLTHVTSIAMLVPTKDGKLSSMDTDVIEVTDKSGRMLEGKYVAVNDHEETTNLQLTQKDKKTYAVEGTAKGKPVKTEIVSKAGLVGEVGQYLLAAQALAKKNKKWTALVFDPSTKPDAAQEVGYEMTADKEDGMPIATMKQGEDRLRVTLDPQGHNVVLYLLGEDGKAAMTIRRVWVEGVATK